MTSLTEARAASGRAGRPLAGAGPRAGTAAVLWGLGFCALVALVQRFDAPAVLLAVAGLLAVVWLLVRPELATLLTVFLLYVNLPGILSKRHGMPAALAGAFVLLLGLPIVRAVVVRREPLRADGTLPLMLAYLAVVLLSTLVARDPQVAFEYARRLALEGLLVYLLVVNAVRTATTLRRVVWTMLAAGSLLGGLAVFQEATGAFRQEFGGLAERNYEFMELRQQDADDPEVRELMAEYKENNRVSGRAPRANGPMDEPNRFGQILVVLLPLALLAFRMARSTRARAAAAAAGLLVACGIFFSGSRGAFLTAVLLAALAASVRWISRTRLAAAALAGTLLLSVAAPQYVARMKSVAGAAAIGADEPTGETDGAIAGRAAVMRAAARVFLDHPVFGVGAGHFQPFYSVDYQRKAAGPAPGEPTPLYAHSLYLQLGAELGVLGLAAFLAIFVHQLRELARARRRWMDARPDLADVATALALGIVGYLSASLFLHLGFQRYLWLLVGLASAALYVMRDAERAEAR